MQFLCKHFSIFYKVHTDTAHGIACTIVAIAIFNQTVPLSVDRNSFTTRNNNNNNKYKQHTSNKFSLPFFAGFFMFGIKIKKEVLGFLRKFMALHFSPSSYDCQTLLTRIHFIGSY